MLRNYILSATRNLLRRRLFSFINIFGLAVSMCVCMAIMMLIADQMTYDRYNSKRDRIYRINSIQLGAHDEEQGMTATAPLPLKEELIANFSGIEKAVRIQKGFGNHWIEVDQNVNIPVSGYFVDPEVLDVFEYELEVGDATTALQEPFSVVLTKKASKKLFRQENPVGEILKVGNDLYKVTGVLRETGRRTHIAFDALASIATIKSLDSDEKKGYLGDWFQNSAGWVYVVIEKGKDETDLQSILRKIEKKQFGTILTSAYQQRIRFSIQNLMGITPGPFIGNPIGPFLPWIFVYFFAGLGSVVMISSCFNFTNLSIARSLTRAREIGVRKVVGARRWQLFVQFLSESVFTALLALIAALILLLLVKPALSSLNFARLLYWDLEANFVVFGVFVLFAAFTGLLAGIFPAIVLSGFQPIKVINGLIPTKLFSRIGLRKTLLAAQFTFSLIFILTVLVVFKQLNLFMKADHGFSMDNKIVVNLSEGQVGPLKIELMKHSNVKNVSAASHVAAAGSNRGALYKLGMEDESWLSISHYFVDEDYMINMELTVVAGQFFDEGTLNDNFIVINEKTVAALGLRSPEEAVGTELIREYDSARVRILGVVKDYNHRLLTESISPMGLIYDPSQFQLLQVKYEGSIQDIHKTIEQAWAATNPTMKADYTDFSSEVHKLYDFFLGDIAHVLTGISAMAVMISCLGLLGMATYTTETRLKEISIRKVLGSGNLALVVLLSKGFVAILIVATLIAVPAAYFVNTLWLEKFAYHITVGANTILPGVLILILFALFTVCSQTIRAAYVKPVDNLKGE